MITFLIIYGSGCFIALILLIFMLMRSTQKEVKRLQKKYGDSFSLYIIIIILLSWVTLCFFIIEMLTKILPKKEEKEK